MKKGTVAFLIVFMALSLKGYAMIQIFPDGKVTKISEDGYVQDDRDHSKVETSLELLLKTTTVFIYGENEKSFVNGIRDAFKQYWTLTPYVVISVDSLQYLPKKKYSFFSVKSEYMQPATFYMLKLWMDGGMTPKKNTVEIKFAEIDLFIDEKTKKGILDNKGQG